MRRRCRHSRCRAAAGSTAARKATPTFEDQIPPATGILGLCWTQNPRKIQLIHQIEQAVHLAVIREPITRRWRQQGRLLRVPRAKSLGHAPILTPRSITATVIWADSGATVERWPGSTRHRPLDPQVRFLFPTRLLLAVVGEDLAGIQLSCQSQQAEHLVHRQAVHR